jgi:hypothetical protein
MTEYSRLEVIDLAVLSRKRNISTSEIHRQRATTEVTAMKFGRHKMPPKKVCNLLLATRLGRSQEPNGLAHLSTVRAVRNERLGGPS